MHFEIFTHFKVYTIMIISTVTVKALPEESKRPNNTGALIGLYTNWDCFSSFLYISFNKIISVVSNMHFFISHNNEFAQSLAY